MRRNETCIDVVADVNFNSVITIGSDISLIVTSSTSAVLDGARSTRFFHVYGSLSIFGITLANGWHSNSGGAVYVNTNAMFDATSCLFFGSSARECDWNGCDDDVGGAGGDDGEAVCEGHGFTETECGAVGCCWWDGIECWSGSSCGGAVYIGSGVTFGATDCLFSANDAFSNGGAVYIGPDATFDATACGFWDNAGHIGGAVFIGSNGKYDETARILHQRGERGATFDATNCDFFGNAAYGVGSRGGAVYVGKGSVFGAIETDFPGNVADYWVKDGLYSQGGAVFVDFSAAFDATDCFFTADTCRSGGGAVFVNKIIISDATGCVFSKNIAGYGSRGGGVGGAVVVVGTFYATQVIFSGNSGNYGGAVFFLRGVVRHAQNKVRAQCCRLSGRRGLDEKRGLVHRKRKLFMA